MASNNGSVDQEQEELLDASSPNKQQNFGQGSKPKSWRARRRVTGRPGRLPDKDKMVSLEAYIKHVKKHHDFVSLIQCIPWKFCASYLHKSLLKENTNITFHCVHHNAGTINYWPISIGKVYQAAKEEL